MNNFEQVSSDGHQMSLAGDGGPCNERIHVGGDSLYSEVPCPEAGLGGVRWGLGAVQWSPMHHG